MKTDGREEVRIAGDSRRSTGIRGEKAGELAEAAIANDNFPVAKQLNELALSQAKQVKDVPLAAQFQTVARRLSRLPMLTSWS